ncbi:MAG TPA: hypothetical protein VD905_07055 [Flavobacteriales bacterium]|nr:hypothetical protein [Flavobacteriales bacterium]
MRFYCIVYLILLNTTNVIAQAPDSLSGAGVFRHLNEAKQAVERWKKGINDRNADELKAVYAGEVAFYLVKRSNADCVKSKMVALQKQPRFKQELKNMELYTVGAGSNMHIIAEFSKVCNEVGGKKEYDAVLMLVREGNEWKVAKETDIKTEVKQFQFKPVADLPAGQYRFEREYWKDNRGDKVLAHDMIRYSYCLEVEINNGAVAGKMTIYSGAIRSVTVYPVISGFVKDGILQITTGYETAEGEINKDNPETMRFKIVNKNEIVLLNEEMPWLYGKVMAATEQQ